MPLVTIPTRAKDRYIELCRKCNEEDEASVASLWKFKANGYMEAIEDLCGSEVAGLIGMEADLTFMENDWDLCCGIRLDR